jgi:hypothetical protein
MAIYGLNTAGQALTASTAADTILYFGSTASANGNTVQAGDGADVVWLGPQGFTADFTGTYTQAGVTGHTGTIYSAGLQGADISYNTALTYQSGDTDTAMIVSGVITSQLGARSLQSSQIWGNAGNDSIYLAPAYIGGATAAPGVTRIQDSTIGGGAGNDVIATVAFVNNTAVTASASTGVILDSAFIEGGGGNDSITFIAVSGLITATTIQGSQGNDVIGVINTAGDMGNTQVLGGGGNDKITGGVSSFDTSTIAGGGGNDTIIWSASNAQASLISLDTFNTQSDYDGNDVFTGAFHTTNTASGVTIQAGGGNDSIHIAVSAADAQDNLYQLNAGNDLLSSVFLSATTIQGGAGNDTIQGFTSVHTSFIQMGGGNDIFSLAGTGSANSTGLSGTTIFGGAGADIFTASANVSGAAMTIGMQFGYSAASDSTLSAYDTISITNTGGTYNFRWVPANANSTSMSATNFTSTNGSVAFTGTVQNDVTARATLLSEAGSNAGSTFAFVDGSSRSFLFISGGDSTVTTDDLLVQVGTGGTSSGGSISVSANIGISMTVGTN